MGFFRHNFFLAFNLLIFRAAKFLVNVAGARMLLPETFGYFSLLYSSADIWQHIFGAGLDLTASRARTNGASDQKSPSWLDTWAQMTNARLGLSIIGVSCGLAAFRWPYNVIFAAWHLFFMQSKFAYALLNAQLNPKSIVWAGLLSQGSLLTSAFLGLKYFGGIGFASAFVLERLIESIILWNALFQQSPELKQKIINNIHPKKWLHALKHWMLRQGGLTLWLAQLLGVLVARVDNILVSNLLGYGPLAYYSLASRSMEAPLFIFAAIGDSSLAYFIRHPEERQNHYAKGILSALLAGIGCALALSLFGLLFADLIFGHQYPGIGHLVIACSWVLVPRGLNMVNSSILIAQGRERLMLKSSAIGFLSNIIGNLIFIPIWGIWAPPACAMISELLVIVLRAYQGFGFRLQNKTLSR